ncbi:hypothetical protein ACSBR1_030778 [Camellia fascicularis]
MNNLTNVVRIQNHQVIVRYVTSNESLHTISECMERLKCIPSLLDTPLFHFALSLMDNVDYREVMMCQPDDDHIIGWLSQKQMQSSTAVPFANLFGVRRGLAAFIVMNNGKDSNKDRFIEMLNEMAIQLQQQNNWTFLEACRYVQEYYEKHLCKNPCRTSILTGHVWITKLYTSHVDRFE